MFSATARCAALGVPLLFAVGLSAQTWTQLNPSGTRPSARSSAAAGYDSAHDRLIIAGGAAQMDVWVLAGASGGAGTPQWTQLQPTGTPPPVLDFGGYGGNYDPASNQLLLFPAYTTGSALWRLTNANGLGGTPAWSQSAVPSGGPTRGPSVYDPVSGRLIILVPGSPTSVPIWNVSGAIGSQPSWTQITTTGTPPTVQYPSSVSYNSISRTLIVFGGGYTDNQQKTFYFNGVYALSNANGGGVGGSAWSTVIAENAAGAPPPRAYSANAYDPATDTLIVFGGNNVNTGVVYGDTWILSNASKPGIAAWRQVTPSPAPAARLFGSSVPAPQTGGMILFGGSSMNDTWVFNGPGSSGLCAAVTPTTGTIGSGGGTAFFSVTAPSSCTWAVAGTPSWLACTPSSSTGSGTVACSAGANTGAARNAPFTIGGTGVSVIQNGGAVDCTITLSGAPGTVPAAGSSGSIAVTVPQPGCSWSASSGQSWLRISAGSSGAGNGTILWTADPNGSSSTRVASITVAGSTNQPSVQFTQSGVNCSQASAYTLSPGAVSVSSAGSGGGSISIRVSTPCGSWGGGSDAAWLQAVGENAGSGNGSVTFKAQANTTGATRSGRVTVNGASVTVVQDGGPVRCFYSLSNESVNTGAAAGSYSVDVTATPGCSWAASLQNAPEGMATLGPASGTGNGTIRFSLSANAGTASRRAVVILQGAPAISPLAIVQTLASFTINQAGSASGVLCTVNAPTSARAVRFEGVTELTDDVVLRCTGRAATAANVYFTLKMNTDVTSRLINAGSDLQTTEALLLAYPAGSQTPAQYRSLRIARDTLLFRPVPFSGAVDYTLRFTNLRADASQRPPQQVVCVIGPCPPLPNSVSAVLSATSSLPVAISGSPVTVASVNYSIGLTTSATAGPNTGQVTVGAQFTAAPNTPFRPRIAAGQDPSQPGQTYVSESGFVNTQTLGSTTGVATNGTRLRLAVSNVPTGVRGIYVQVSPAGGGATLVTADSSGAGGGFVNCAIPNLCVNVAGVDYVRIDPRNTATWEVQAAPANNSFTFNVVFDGLTVTQAQAVTWNSSYAPLVGPALAARDVIPRFSSGESRPAAFTAASVSGLLAPKYTILPTAPIPRDAAANVSYQMRLSANIGDGTTSQPVEARSNLTYGAKFGSQCTPIVAGVSNPAGSSCTISEDAKTAVVNFDLVSPNTAVEALLEVIPDDPVSTAIQYCDTISTLSGTQPTECVMITPVTVQSAISGAYISSPQYTPGGITQMPVTFPVRVLSSGSSLVSIGGVDLSVDPTRQVGGTILTFRGWADGTTTPTYSPKVGQDPLLLTALYSDSTHTAPAKLLTPALTAVLGSTASFTWTAVTAATQYQLTIGTQVGLNDVFTGTAGNKTQENVSGLPQNGTPLFVRLRTYWSDLNQPVDYLFQTSTSGGGNGQTGLLFVPLPGPCRAVDTRSPAQYPASGPRLANGETRSFALAGVCGIPAGAAAYSLNATVVPVGEFAYLSLWPSGQPQPLVSTLNSLDGRIRANAAIVPASTSGAISAYVTNAADLVFDVNGYFIAPPVTGGLAFYPVTPCRIADTRSDPPAGGVISPIGRNSTRNFPINGVARCGIPSGAQAYSLNVTAVPRESVLSYLTLWPTGVAQPLASTLNAPTGTITANAAILPAGSGGVNVFVVQNTDAVLDINGYFAAPGSGGLSFYKLDPCRIADTRDGTLGAFGKPSMAASETRSFAIPQSKCGPPATARAWSLNATVVPTSGTLGYLTLWPADQNIPLVSTLNSVDGAILANAALVPAAAAGGAIKAYVTNATDLVLDVNGYFAP